jgi:methylphosphotriester-DNA--protein-cysteine methyltransferase
VVVVGSKTGRRYHLPDCPGAKRIKPANLITFESIEAAKAAGYTPAANCDFE